MVPKFGLLGSLQGNNDPSFIAKVNQELAFSLGIEYLLQAKKKNKKGRERQLVQFFYMCNLDSNIYFNAEEDKTI